MGWRIDCSLREGKSALRLTERRNAAAACRALIQVDGRNAGRYAVPGMEARGVKLPILKIYRERNELNREKGIFRFA